MPSCRVIRSVLEQAPPTKGWRLATQRPLSSRNLPVCLLVCLPAIVFFLPASSLRHVSTFTESQSLLIFLFARLKLVQQLLRQHSHQRLSVLPGCFTLSFPFPQTFRFHPLSPNTPASASFAQAQRNSPQLTKMADQKRGFLDPGHPPIYSKKRKTTTRKKKGPKREGGAQALEALFDPPSPVNGSPSKST